MRHHSNRLKVSLSLLGATFLFSTTALAQTPLQVEESVEQANAANDRVNDEALRLAARESTGGNTIRTTNASFGLPSLPQDTDSEAIGAPAENYYFEDDEPRGFWRSQNGRRIVHPVTAQNYNDDAYVTTDVRAHYINHQFPRNATTSGGAIRIYGVQLRYAVDEALQLQVSKLSFNDLHLLGETRDGEDDLAIAAKYAFIQDWDRQLHASIGLGYEFGTGDNDTFAGDDEARIFGAINKGFDRSHLGLSVNLLLNTEGQDALGNSDRLSAHLHYDYELNDQISPLLELNYYATLDNGSPVTPFNGLDLANLGGNTSEGTLSGAVGGEFRYARDLAVRIAYEAPLTSNVDLFGYRWTLSAVWRF